MARYVVKINNVFVKSYDFVMGNLRLEGFMRMPCGLE